MPLSSRAYQAQPVSLALRQVSLPQHLAMKITYHAAASRDGFIARADGDVSWLDAMNLSPEETGLAEFFAGIDGLVMGRKTYDFILSYGSWPYEDKPSWVCTHSEIEVLEGATLRVASDVDTVLSQAAGLNLQHLWLVGGGQLASSFLERGLITHVRIAEMPIRLAQGIPLLSKHRLSEIDCAERQVVDKGKFRQIELTLMPKGDDTNI